MSSITIPNFLEVVQSDIQRVEDWLQEQLRFEHEELEPLLAQLRGFQGKRLRSAQVFLIARSLGKVSPWHTSLAGILEMIHCATLIHDDVLDGATMRRGRSCLHQDFAWKEAILMGDWVYARALSCSTHFEDLQCSRVLADATARVCRGEIRQNLSSGNFDLSEPSYLEMVDGKTSALFEAGGRLAAHYSQANSVQLEAAARHGFLVGRAFQLADDLLDVSGEETTMGKTLGTDWERKKMTLPTLRLRDSLGKEDLSQLRATFGSSRQLQDLCAGSLEQAYEDACESTRKELQQQLQEATSELEVFPSGEAKDSLVSLTMHCGNRHK